MSWMTDRFADMTRNQGNVAKWMANNSIAGILNNKVRGTNEVSDFFQREFIDKADLRGTEIGSIMAGLPVVGGVYRGIEGINQLEDLYNNSGKTVEYLNKNLGGAGIGNSLGALTRKIEGGVHDLASFYSGEDMTELPIEGKDFVTADKL